jgi:hypothetical protein
VFPFGLGARLTSPGTPQPPSISPHQRAFASHRRAFARGSPHCIAIHCRTSSMRKRPSSPGVGKGSLYNNRRRMLA